VLLRSPIGLLAGVCLLSAAAALAADAEATGKRLEGVERSIDKDRATHRRLDRKVADLAEEIDRLRHEKVASAAAIRGGEAEMSRLEALLAQLMREEAQKASGLAARRRQMADVLSSLTRLARHPPAAIIVQPLSPADAVRGGILLRTSVGEIEQRADRLRAELEALAIARRSIADRSQELRTKAAALQAERLRLDGLLAKTTELHRQAAADSSEAAARIRRLSREARDLRELLVRLGPETDDRSSPLEGGAVAPPSPRLVLTPPPESGRSITNARGTLPFPVVGRVVGRYGEESDSGLISKGITIETRPGAQVVAPHQGRVAFVGPFRGYGQLLIIEHGEAYHSLMTGFDRIDAVIGQLVFGGEPVGVMGYPDDGKPNLYLELRRNNRPVDPLPWFAASEAKVSG
jgi:septal ring factor EnvC (AmiA/AmiB activator)